MKKAYIVPIFVFVFLLTSFRTYSVKAQPYYDAWLTHVYVTNGNTEIDLINGGMAKVYDGQEVAKRIEFYNHGCGTFGADLYTRIYLNNALLDTSSETHVTKGSSDRDEFSQALTGPGIYTYKVELWWENWGAHLLVDIKEFQVKVVKLAVSDWASSTVSIERGFEAKEFSITLANGGNDFMYGVSVSVLDSKGLVVVPLAQDLGTISEGGTKTTQFSVQASRDTAPKDYIMIFQVVYTDLRGVAHEEPFQSNVNVASNLLRENLNYIIIAVIVVIISLLASLLYIRKRKHMRIPPPPPPPATQ